MDDDEIIARGGTQEDIDKYAHDNGACGLAYDGTCSDCSPLNTKSQTDNTELDEIKKTVWECIRYNEFNLSDTEAVGVIMQAVEAKLKQQDIKSRIDEQNKIYDIACDCMPEGAGFNRFVMKLDDRQKKLKIY